MYGTLYRRLIGQMQCGTRMDRNLKNIFVYEAVEIAMHDNIFVSMWTDGSVHV